MNKKFSLSSKQNVMALAVASSLSLVPMWADAAGLGRITVYSALGQPLRAEVQVKATREELPGMTARLAPPESFQQAGVDYSSALNQLRFVVEKKAGGAVIKVSSDKPINDPFLDFLLELNWPTGRLVREYTFLLDPPEVTAQSLARQAVSEARLLPALAAGGEQGEVFTRPAPAASVQTATPPAEKVAAKAEGGQPKAPASQHVVKPGETLRSIATANLPGGVSLEQMLVALYRNNADAFAGNMNRMRAGSILQIPSKDEAAAIPQSEARKVFTAQSSEWNSYRRKLAGAAESSPVTESAASRAASGQVSAKVEEKLPPAEQSKDQVKVSRTTQAAGKAGVSEEDVIAKDKALKESQERLSMLEKNVAELQQLLELKNQSLAEMEQRLAKQATVPPAPPAAPAVPEVKPEVKPAPAPVEEAKPAVPAAASEAPKAAEPAPAPVAEKTPPKPPAPPKKPVVVEPPMEEPGLLDGIDPLYLGGGGAALLGLLGLLFYRRRRAAPQEASPADVLPEAPAPVANLSSSSVFQSDGGQSVDTTYTSPPATDFSQAGPGAIDTDEVDPVAEADVYMAYGRDAQAEEILLDAMQKDPQRTAIHAKLLEIYANRRSIKQFETLATELYAQTGGQGPEWAKVAALGRGLDGSNPLYGAVAAATVAGAGVAAFDAEATVVVSPAEALAALGSAPAPVPAVEAVAEPANSLDFVSETKPLAPVVTEVPAADAAASLGDGGLDFDLGASTDFKPKTAEAPPAAVEPEPASSILDFDLGGTNFAPAQPAAAESAAPAKDVGTDSEFSADLSATVVNPDLPASLDFDLGLEVENKQDAQLSWEENSSFTAADLNLDELAVSGESEESLLAMDSEPAISEAAAADDGLLNFDLNLPEFAPKAEAQAKSAEQILEDYDGAQTLVMPSATLASLESDLEEAQPEASPALGMAGGFDLSGLSLDLGAPAEATPAAAPAAAEPVASVSDSRRDEVNTKLDLAKAYEEMGDLEGARELLNEVVSEGAPDQVEQARSNLDRLNA